MASLPLCSTTAISSHSHLSPRPLPLSKPPQFSTRSRSTVSCSTENDEKTNFSLPKVDRRNLLVGMGGLYGATNLDPSLAAPISAPDLAKCSLGTNLNKKEPLDVNCCPPTSVNIVDYKLPPVKKPRVRQPAHLVSEQFIAKYEKATALMKALPPDDPRNFMQQANVHCAYCNLTYEQAGDPTKKLQIHFSWLFFPWHRWYLYFYERILAKLIDDSTFALPYWNWDHPDGMVMPAYFSREGSSLFNTRRNQAHIPSVQPTPLVDLLYSRNNQTDPSIIIPSNLTEMYSEMVRNAVAPEDFYGAKYITGSDPDPGAGSIERGSHTAVHSWVGDPRSPAGEDMGNFYSTGREPLFFAHHANVDRMWSVWRDLRGKKQVYFTESDWLDASFLFYDENKELVRVKVREALDERKMGFTYQKQDLPWLNSRPKPRVKGSKIATTAKAPRAEEAKNFPVKLDSVVRVLVDRPKKSRSKKDKENEEELLVIDGIQVDSSKFVRFDVFVNDEDDLPGDVIDSAEYAGCYSQVPHKNASTVKSRIRLGLTELLEDLDVEGDDQILVSLVPREGGEDITIGGLKIIYVNV